MKTASRSATTRSPKFIAKGLIQDSDGLIEPENVYGEEFGIPRLEQAAVRVQTLTPREVCESLMASVEEWAGTPEQADDMTVLVARLK